VNEADATVPFNLYESGATPLHLAVRFDQPEVAKILLDHGADVNARSQSGMTPLMEATSKSRRPRFDEKLVKLLVARGAKFEAEDAFGLTPLRPAIFSTPADVEELKLLVSLGANVNWQGRKVHRISGYADHIISDGETYLMEAVELGRLDAVKALLACGADKSLRDDSGYNAEFYSSRDAQGGKNWREHLKGDKKEIYELVSQPGVSYADESSSKERLSKEQDADVGSLVANGADVNARNEKGETQLHRVAGKPGKGVELLLAHGADVNAKDLFGDTPLHKAASADNKELTALLLAHGADVNARDMIGYTPLHCATFKDESELLLAHGADANAKDDKGQTPLHLAVSDDPKDYKGVVKQITESDLARIEVLLAHGADVNATDNDGRTPLFYAKIGAIAKLLREHGGHK
jgi:ankyrin repeat protein